MRNLRLSRRPMCLLALVAFVSGCQVLYPYRPVPVLVRDAETKVPIADADVHLTYPLSRDSVAPFDSSERTGADGVARLRAAPYGDFGVRVEASAKGYMTEQQTIATESIQKLEAPHLFEKVEQRKPEIVVEMFAEPRFSVELIVPVGYRGRIKAEVQYQDDLPIQPRQRCFSYEVVNGLVRIKGPHALRRVYPSAYRARYADGTPLTEEMTLTKVGFRWLRGDGQEQYYVVGTQSEYDVERRMTADDTATPKSRPSSNGNGGGQGRHHRSE